MSSDHQTSKPTPKNSLLSAAATGFAFEESAALLVPVTLQDEPSSAAAPATDIPPATAEIDLNSEDDGNHVDLMAPSLMPVNTVYSNAEEMHVSASTLFASTASTSANNDDPFLRLVPGINQMSMGVTSSDSYSDNATNLELFSSPLSTMVSPSQTESSFQNQTQVAEEKPKESFFSFGSFLANAAKVNFFSSSSSASSNNQKQIEQPSIEQANDASQYPYGSAPASNPYYVPPVYQQQNVMHHPPPLNASGMNPSTTPPIGNQYQQHQQHYPPPTLSNSTPPNVAPVPLMTPAEVQAAIPPSAPPATSNNSYRLKNQKRLSYAQYPGLTGTTTNVTSFSPAELFPTGPPVMPPSSNFEPSTSSPYVAPSTTTPFIPISSPSARPVTPTTTYEPRAQSFYPIPSTVTAQPGFSPQSAFVPQGSQAPQNVFIPQPMFEVPQSVVSTESTFATHSEQAPFSTSVVAPTPIYGNGAPLVPTTSKAVQQPQNVNSPLPPTPGQSSSPSQPTKKAYNPPKMYTSLRYHWFCRKVIANKLGWKAFSMKDSDAIEQAFLCQSEDPVPVDGGRYDVDLKSLKKVAVYWEEAACDVKRCSWFYKGPLDSRFVPYDDDVCLRLEKEYAEAFETGKWNRRIKFPNGEAITLHSPGAMAHICRAAAPDEWGNVPEDQIRPRVVKRGVEEFDIEIGESARVDHLVLLVHGIGAICDFKFRSIVEAVDGFRNLSFPLMRDHFKEAVDANKAGRVEFLPISWHKALHGEGGIDDKLKSITLKSIPLLRSFTNDTLLDILFYTSPHYAQNIIDTVGNEMNRIFNLFCSRNPDFNGLVGIAGHSLGSLILFDLLAHQPKDKTSESKGIRNSEHEGDSMSETNSGVPLHANESVSRLVSYTFGPVGNGTGQPQIIYPVLEFQPTAFFALGSPIAMFVTIRGIERLGQEFHFPTCPAFFNIFHPFDPVAYRIETLIDSQFDSKPILIPHHKGRKRLHLELKETMQKIGSDVKQKVVESVVATWNMITYYTSSKTPEEIKESAESEKKAQEEAMQEAVDDIDDEGDQDIGLGRLNGGRRVDFVLQEAPLESFNEYLFALSSHVCYWESDDTMLMILKEIYASLGVREDKSRPSSAVSDTTAGQTSDIFHQSAAAPVQTAAYPVSEVGTYPPTTVLYSRPEATPVFPSPVTSLTPPIMFNPHDPRNQAIVGHTSSLPPVPPSGMPQDGSKKPLIIGARPVVSTDELQNLRGMDPTAPINAGSVGPPPLAGFRPKQ